MWRCISMMKVIVKHGAGVVKSLLVLRLNYIKDELLHFSLNSFISATNFSSPSYYSNLYLLPSYISSTNSTPETSTMSTVWYCCQCSNGPMGTSVNVSCSQYNCGHNRCGGCHVVQQEYFVYGDSHAVLSQQATSLESPLVENSTNIGIAMAIGNVYTSSTHGFGEPTDAGEYRWTCSECFADNSYDHDAACWNCQHWKCGSCGVYEVIRK